MNGSEQSFILEFDNNKLHNNDNNNDNKNNWGLKNILYLDQLMLLDAGFEEDEGK